MTDIKYMPGDYMKLGVTRQGNNTNFAVAIGDTDEVFLKLFKNASDTQPECVIKLDGEYRTGNIFSVCVNSFSFAGWTYLYEAKGVSFVDPYARLISGREVYGRMLGAKASKLIRAYVWENRFDWKNEKAPRIDFSELIIYKLHVRGFTKNAGVKNKGSYRGLCEKIPYIKDMGFNAVLLMPVMEYNEVCSAEPEVGVPEFVSSRFYKGENGGKAGKVNGMPKEMAGKLSETLPPDELDPKGETAEELPYIEDHERRVNYWGYTGFYHFFAPKASYAKEPAKADYEFKQMVYKLHEAGIEVLMEVSIPKATNRSMMLDALRFWVREYHIDGFRLNLDNIDPSLIACDPYLSSAKLIGNGWNVDNIYPRQYSPDSKKLGIYNDAYSVEMRKFLKSDESMSGQALRHFTENKGKTININYVTDHNGFTLADLYMYDIKHNEANGEHGTDGTDQNHSWNCGVEGPDKHKKIRELRLKMRKNALTMLLLGQGVPLIFAGDEFGNSQNGNNNAYCQDNECGWLDWKKSRDDAELQNFVKELIALRKSHPVLRNKVELRSMDYLSSGIPDVSFHSLKAWYPDYNFYNRCIGILYSGDYALLNRKDSLASAHTKDDVKDDCFYFAVNMYWDDREFEIPHVPGNKAWSFVLSTVKMELTEGSQLENPTIVLPGRSITVLKSVALPEKPVKISKATKAKTVKVEKTETGKAEKEQPENGGEPETNEKSKAQKEQPKTTEISRKHKDETEQKNKSEKQEIAENELV